MAAIKSSGTIQCQLVSAGGPGSAAETGYDWDLEIEDGNTLVFLVTYDKPDLISNKGVDRDYFRIFFQFGDTSYIRCKDLEELGDAPDVSERRLLKEETLEEAVAKALGEEIEEVEVEFKLIDKLEPVLFKVFIPPQMGALTPQGRRRQEIK